MRFKALKSAILLGVGVAVGFAIGNTPQADATASEVDMSNKTFHVYINEVSQNFVFGDEFVGSYKKSVTLSDGSNRTIELTPMIHDGKQVVKFWDTGSHSYMGLNGTTTNGTLMVQVLDAEEVERQLTTQGWGNVFH